MALLLTLVSLVADVCINPVALSVLVTAFSVDSGCVNAASVVLLFGPFLLANEGNVRLLLTVLAVALILGVPWPQAARLKLNNPNIMHFVVRFIGLTLN